MDCKPEPRARTFVRIAILCIEGLLTGVLIGAWAAITAPLTVVFSFYRAMKNTNGWRRWVLIPAFIVHSLIVAVVMPFAILAHHIASSIELAKIEWITRWMAAQPKTPNGHPME